MTDDTTDQCSRCPETLPHNPLHTFDGEALCDDCDDSDCGNCGGEGLVYDCIDGQCLDAEYGCKLCAMRCDYCTPATPAPLR
jgi:hypothetical protein